MSEDHAVSFLYRLDWVVLVFSADVYFFYDKLVMKSTFSSTHVLTDTVSYIYIAKRRLSQFTEKIKKNFDNIYTQKHLCNSLFYVDSTSNCYNVFQNLLVTQEALVSERTSK